jgi:nitronate monooxygenase
MDPDNLPSGDKDLMDFAKHDNSDAKAWKDIWGAGQGVGSIDEILPAKDLVMQLEAEYQEARKRLL